MYTVTSQLARSFRVEWWLVFSFWLRYLVWVLDREEFDLRCPSHFWYKLPARQSCQNWIGEKSRSDLGQRTQQWTFVGQMRSACCSVLVWCGGQVYDAEFDANRELVVVDVRCLNTIFYLDSWKHVWAGVSPPLGGVRHSWLVKVRLVDICRQRRKEIVKC